MLFPEVQNIIVSGKKRPGLVLLSRYNLRINLTVFSPSVILSPLTSASSVSWENIRAGERKRQKEQINKQIPVIV